MGEYREKFAGKSVDLIGTLKTHTWRDAITLQFHVMDAVVR